MSRKPGKKRSKRKAKKPSAAKALQSYLRSSVDDAPQVARLKSDLRRAHRELRRVRGGAGLIVDAVRESLQEPPDLVIPPRPPADRRRKAPVEEAFLHVSDTQLGKRTETYSSTVCRMRLEMLTEKVIEITRMRRSAAKVETIHVLLGGDMVEGETIFGGQAWECDADLMSQAVMDGPAMISRMLLQLAQEFRFVKVACVPGNHGRNGSKYQQVSKRTNWDTVFYRVASLMTLGPEDAPRSADLAKRLTFEIPDSFWAVQNVAGWGVLGVHGDQIRGGFAGFPYYGTAKKAWGWIDSIPAEWTYLAFGHFHTYAMGVLNKRIFLANGTTECGNVYAQEQLAASGDPCQRLAFFNRRHGLIADHQVFLGGARTPNYE
jgi:hypothetical protein